MEKTMLQYNPTEIEPRWRRFWEEQGLHRARRTSGRPKYYCLDMFPYPSGEGLHVGHWRGYVLSDVWSRYMTLRGYQVMHPMGWDAFGLPAENAAIKHGIHPAEYTRRAIANMKRQLGEIGAMYDWDREINSSSPDYYRWTQWTFLQLYKAGLAYRKEAPINWCPSCRTGLADEEVKDGRCERCETEVTKKNLPQWFYRITRYAQRLIDDLEGLQWPEKVKKMQADWIGRSEGAEVKFRVQGHPGLELEIFTTRPDTLFGATYMVLAPEHPLVDTLTTPDRRAAVEEYVRYTRSRSEVDRLEQKEKTGVFTGAYAINPVNDEAIPIWVADYVLMGYGTGAIMAVPGHDTRDWEFARTFGLPIRQVILTPEQNRDLADRVNLVELSGEASEILDQAYASVYPTLPLTEAYVDEGWMINSGPFSGMPSAEGRREIVRWLEGRGLARFRVNYKLRDWLISRQRYWGAPIPIVYCPSCGEVPVPENQLPVELPHVEKYQPSGTGESPLAAIPEFVNTSCPKCGGAARRDTDTLSQWICSSWYFLRYASPHNDQQAWTREEVDYWLPVDMYVGGIEHAVLHLLYSRFYTKVFYDLGLIGFVEPFVRLFNQGMITRVGLEGRLMKMSKSKGNVVAPDDLVARYGSDSLRAYELFIGPPEEDSEWNDSGIEGVYRWIKRVWGLVMGQPVPQGPEEPEVLRATHAALKKITEDLERLHLNTCVSSLMEWLNTLYARRQANPQAVTRETLKTYVTVMAPIAPHVAEELWAHLGGTSSLFAHASWPTWDERYLAVEEVELVVQVNGKVRDRVRVPFGASQEEVEGRVLALERVSSSLDGRKVRRIIYIPNKLVNIVLE
jgi:leucyl-tRNA synthetase